MKVLVFDTETTGLTKVKNPSIFDFDKWPYVVQLSYILYDTEEKLIDDMYDVIIKIPDHIDIDVEAEKMHKISKERTKLVGIHMKDVLKTFNSALNKADIIVGHNISFDKCLIMVECNRNNLRQCFTIDKIKKQEYCTMKNTKDVCKIEKTFPSGDKYFKYPTLSELYKHFFGFVPENAHNSMVDIILCLRCYIMITNHFDIFDTNGELETIIDKNI
jgi:DNA polymerase-3 subunit epsilon